MKRRLLILAVVLLLVLLCGCSVQNETSYFPSDTDYSKELNMDTPEGIAKAITDTYAGMTTGDIDPKEGFERLLAFSPSTASEKMLEFKDQFVREINQTKDYFEANSDGIERFQFSKTEYKSENEASIYRIQYQKNGKKYYFVQDFVKENGAWKVKGDNISNPFVIKKKFLFWYL